MKRVISLVFFVLFSLQLFADSRQQPINIERKGGPRDGLTMYQDLPQAYYCYDDKSQWIIIDGGVEISSPVTNTVEISTQVDGTYDTFDISSLPAGSHVITIVSPSGNVYEGTFTTY